jgi:predicted DCC family thiol-disulfide oxidoreductase YuxK
MSTKAIVLFDGDCAYCNRWVRWVMARDKEKNRLSFEPLDQPNGTALLHAHGLHGRIDTVVLLEDGQAWLKSDAVWRILAHLPKYRWAALLLRAVPRPLRNAGYSLVARYRHRIAGGAQCSLPADRP